MQLQSPNALLVREIQHDPQCELRPPMQVLLLFAIALIERICEWVRWQILSVNETLPTVLTWHSELPGQFRQYVNFSADNFQHQ